MRLWYKVEKRAWNILRKKEYTANHEKRFKQNLWGFFNCLSVFLLLLSIVYFYVDIFKFKASNKYIIIYCKKDTITHEKGFE